jgi:hypothetical protein
MIKKFSLLIVLCVLSLMASASFAQTYGTWGAESTSNSIIHPYLGQTEVGCPLPVDKTLLLPTATTHGHPNYLGKPFGDSCLITKPVTMRYFYKTKVVSVPANPRPYVRCYITYHKQQCLQ